MGTKKTSALEVHLQRVLDGDITFDDAARATRAEWDRMAAYLARRWIPPAWYEASEDIVQELLLGAWRWIWSWNPNRGVSLARYVVWNAMGDAKTRLHAARGALLSGTRDKNPSRFEKPFSAFLGAEDDGSDERFLDNLLRIEPEVDAFVERQASVEAAVGVCTSAKERAVVYAIAEAQSLSAGTLDDAADILYADRGMRAAFNLRSENDAVDLVVDAATSVGVRLGWKWSDEIYE